MKKEEILEKGDKTSRIVSIAAFFAAGMKLLVGFMSGSIALLSDALHSTGDAFSILFVWLGFKISKREPTEKFPYGFYKAESLVSLLISFLILYASYEIGMESYESIFTSSQLRLPFVAIAVSVFDAFFIFFLGNYEVKVGKEINSQSLIAHGREAKLHILSSLLVVIGILSSYFGIARVEGIVGILFAFLILKVGLESLKDSVFSLMDVSPSKEIEEKAKKILERQEEVKDFSGLKLRTSGPFIFGELNVKIKKFARVEKAYEIVNKIEKKLKEEIPQIDSLTIHIEPFQSVKKRIIIPVKERDGFHSIVDEQFARAGIFSILMMNKGKIESIDFVENPFGQKEIRAGLSVVEYLLERNPDVLLVKDIGPISFHTLRDNLVEMYKVEGRTVQEAVIKFSEGNLEKLKKPTKEKK